VQQTVMALTNKRSKNTALAKLAVKEQCKSSLKIVQPWQCVSATGYCWCQVSTILSTNAGEHIQNLFCGVEVGRLQLPQQLRQRLHKFLQDWLQGGNSTTTAAAAALGCITAINKLGKEPDQEHFLRGGRLADGTIPVHTVDAAHQFRRKVGWDLSHNAMTNCYHSRQCSILAFSDSTPLRPTAVSSAANQLHNVGYNLAASDDVPCIWFERCACAGGKHRSRLGQNEIHHCDRCQRS
jgi:hypothetical protein